MPTIEGKRRTWYARSRPEARILLKEKLNQQTQHRLLASPAQVVETYLWQWHRQRAQAVSYGTATSYAANIRRALPALGRLRLDEVRAAHLDELYAAETERGLSAASVRQLHRTLRAAFNQAIKQELLYRNPADGATQPRPRAEERRIPRPDDVTALLRGTAHHRLGALWALLATTGLRSGEAIGLRWQDIDLERGQLTIQQTPERRTGQGICFKDPKTPKSKRTVLILPGLVERLKALRSEQLRTANVTGRFPPVLVFTTEVDTPLDVSAVWRQHDQALKRCGLPHFRVHDLRHAVTTYLISRGVPMAVVQAILGHASSRLTTEVYAHLVATHQEQALPILAELLPAS